MARSKWSISDMPDLSGQTIVVTGANSGIGLEAVRGFAGKGAHVVLACRSAEKAQAAIASVRGDHPGASLEFGALDLASLESIREFAQDFRDRHDDLNVLCNNAGVMAIPRRETADGFEMQLGTNHLGHFALTGLLLDRILHTDASRVVTVSSTAHQLGRLNFDDLQSEAKYGRWRAYGQSKIANLYFTYELQRRFAARSADAIAVACHPGYAATELQFRAARMDGSSLKERAFGLMNRIFAQDAAGGALPTLYAAASPDVVGGDYIGPSGFMEQYGPPTKVKSVKRSHDRAEAIRLWELSEKLTGVRYSALEG